MGFLSSDDILARASRRTLNVSHTVTGIRDPLSGDGLAQFRAEERCRRRTIEICSNFCFGPISIRQQLLLVIEQLFARFRRELLVLSYTESQHQGSDE